MVGRGWATHRLSEVVRLFELRCARAWDPSELCGTSELFLNCTLLLCSPWRRAAQQADFRRAFPSPSSVIRTLSVPSQGLIYQDSWLSFVVEGDTENKVTTIPVSGGSPCRYSAPACAYPLVSVDSHLPPRARGGAYDRLAVLWRFGTLGEALEGREWPRH